MSKKKEPHQRYDFTRGLCYETNGYSTRIVWTPLMIDMLRRDFPTSLNEELSGAIGVSVRTMTRKARELGIYKDPSWLHEKWKENAFIAGIILRSKGYPGTIKKGQHLSPETEFKSKK